MRGSRREPLLKGCERPEDLLGDGGLMMDLKRVLMQRMPGAELADHPDHERGLSAKTVREKYIAAVKWMMSWLGLSEQLPGCC